ncbi:MauE/DoxX family redox-associated membrane protein [Benzoatithermus flavus]|uniref:Methylamine utilization protein MauE n=1 Tax=Benzoatithermus flavus TaxID=3108223 RepID=A0ABU8XY16_9PROT
MSLDPALALTLALVLAAIFATAAIAKLKAMSAFVGVVENYRLLPPPLVTPAAWALPPVELLAALGLLFPPTRPFAALVVAALLLLFALAIGINLARGRDRIDCGCFVGLLRQRLSWGLVGRNLVLALAGLVLTLDRGASRPLAVLDAVTVLAAVLCLLLLYAAVSRLFGVAPTPLKQAS